MTAFCRDHNIGLLPYGVVAGGFLSDKFLGVPPAQVRHSAPGCAVIGCDDSTIDVPKQGCCTHAGGDNTASPTGMMRQLQRTCNSNTTP